MFSSADKVKGQGVGSAYLELIKMLEKDFPNTFEINVNKWGKSDISHYHTVDPHFYLSTFFKKYRGRKIGYVHFVPETLEDSLDLIWPFKKIFETYLVSFYKRMDHLVVVNPSFIPVLENLGIANDKITYIPNFVSQDVFYEETPEKKALYRKNYGYQEDDFIVLGAGQIQERKGVDDFVKLAENNPSIQFVWAGGFSFGQMSGGYKKYKEMYENPPKNLNFTGIISREELANYYNIADTFLLPSHNELFPMCILEAFSCGTPVMLRDLELYHAIIKDYYIPTADYEEMDCLLKELSHQPEQLKKWEDLSKEASAYYSEANLSKIWSQFYMEQAAKYSYQIQGE